MKGKPGEWYQDKHIVGYFNENGDFQQYVKNIVGLMQIQMHILWKFRMDVGIMMQLGNFDIMTTFIDIYDYLHILIAVRFTTGGSACVLTPFVG